MTDISRRSAAKGVAWSIPAITVAAAAPAVAASLQPSQVYVESNIQDYSRNYRSGQPDNETTPQRPVFTNTGTLAFYKTNATSMTVSAVTYTLVITSPNATFSLENGTNESAWSIPSAPSSTTTLNGTTAYVYDFTYIAPGLPLVLTDDSGSGNVFGQLTGDDTILFIQVRSGDGIDVGSPFQGRLSATIDGTKYDRSSDIGTIVDGKNGPNYVIGDSI